MQLIQKYFPNLTPQQTERFAQLDALYRDWNAKINVISRKDIDNLYPHHVLHSLGIAKVINFRPDTEIMDIGTGGGFPGIPLAIMFPECRFYLIDSIGNLDYTKSQMRSREKALRQVPVLDIQQGQSSSFSLLDLLGLKSRITGSSASTPASGSGNSAAAVSSGNSSGAASAGSDISGASSAAASGSGSSSSSSSVTAQELQLFQQLMQTNGQIEVQYLAPVRK